MHGVITNVYGPNRSSSACKIPMKGSWTWGRVGMSCPPYWRHCFGYRHGQTGPSARQVPPGSWPEFWRPGACQPHRLKHIGSGLPWKSLQDCCLNLHHCNLKWYDYVHHNIEYSEWPPWIPWAGRRNPYHYLQRMPSAWGPTPYATIIYIHLSCLLEV